jgi:hypothetical protein
MPYAVVLQGRDDVAAVLMMVDDRGEADAIAVGVRAVGHAVEVRQVGEGQLKDLSTASGRARQGDHAGGPPGHVLVQDSAGTEPLAVHVASVAAATGTVKRRRVGSGVRRPGAGPLPTAPEDRS